MKKRKEEMKKRRNGKRSLNVISGSKNKNKKKNEKKN